MAYICDEIGLHRVCNRNLKESAISLHLYSPPILNCQTFNENDSKARKSSCCTFFTIKGKRTPCNQSIDN